MVFFIVLRPYLFEEHTQTQLPNNSIRETSLTDDDEGFEGRMALAIQMSLAIDDRLPMTSHMNTV